MLLEDLKNWKVVKIPLRTQKSDFQLRTFQNKSICAHFSYRMAHKLSLLMLLVDRLLLINLFSLIRMFSFLHWMDKAQLNELKKKCQPNPAN